MWLLVGEEVNGRLKSAAAAFICLLRIIVYEHSEHNAQIQTLIVAEQMSVLL